MPDLISSTSNNTECCLEFATGAGGVREGQLSFSTKVEHPQNCDPPCGKKKGTLYVNDLGVKQQLVWGTYVSFGSMLLVLSL